MSAGDESCCLGAYDTAAEIDIMQPRAGSPRESVWPLASSSHAVGTPRSALFDDKTGTVTNLGMQVARRRGAKKAIVALARRLAGVMHRMWVDGTEFRWRKEADTKAA